MSYSVKAYRSICEEIRDILGVHVALQQKNGLLLVEHDRDKAELDWNKAEIDILRAAHNRLDTNYINLFWET